MNFDLISQVSLQRAQRWHPGGLKEWSPSDWSNAMFGEAGELANAVKKLRRLEGELRQAEGPKSVTEAKAKVAMETGDTYLYADLTLQRLGLSPRIAVTEYLRSGRHKVKIGRLVERSNHIGMCAGSVCSAIDVLEDYLAENHSLGTYTDHLNSVSRATGELIVRLDDFASFVFDDDPRALERCVVDTFNRVSIRENFPERLELEAA